jgi:hypothetical protein
VHNSAEELVIMTAVIYLSMMLFCYPNDKDIQIALHNAFNAEYDYAKAIFEVSGSPTTFVVSEGPNTS